MLAALWGLSVLLGQRIILGFYYNLVYFSFITAPGAHANLAL